MQRQRSRIVKTNKRRDRGVITIEFAIGSLFLIVVTALAINITLMMLAYEVNDRACRNACRAAAQQDSPAHAQNAASAVLNSVGVDGYFLQQPSLLTSDGDFQYEDFGGDPIAAGNTSPFVTVTSRIQVKTPAPLFFFGNAFGDRDGDGTHSTGDLWTFRKQYTFPIVTVNLVLPPT
ncbi:MAG: hypothetical protein K2Z81_18350 [Cyanobacteria bacterium]|nr:hypothetical protein [Cyanobacteriota bacterium]